MYFNIRLINLSVTFYNLRFMKNFIFNIKFYVLKKYQENLIKANKQNP